MMKNFNEYRNFYAPSDETAAEMPAEIPEGMPEPKTYKEWAVAKLCGLNFGEPPMEPKTPIEKYLGNALLAPKELVEDPLT